MHSKNVFHTAKHHHDYFFNNNLHTLIQYMKEQQNHDVSVSRFCNDRNKYYYNSKTLSKNKHDYHLLFIQLQILISISEKKTCQNMFFCQQENISSQLKCEFSSRKFDNTYFTIK